MGKERLTLLDAAKVHEHHDTFFELGHPEHAKASDEHHNCPLVPPGKYRIEAGLPVVTAIATPELLSNDVIDPTTRAITKKGLSHPTYMEGMPDAMGKRIVLGQPMTYIDFYARRDHEAGLRPEPHSWYVFELMDDDTHAEWHPMEISDLLGNPKMNALVAERVAGHEAYKESGAVKVFTWVDEKTGGAKAFVHVLRSDHPMHGKRWHERGQFATLAEAEACVKLMQDTAAKS